MTQHNLRRFDADLIGPVTFSTSNGAPRAKADGAPEMAGSVRRNGALVWIGRKPQGLQMASQSGKVTGPEGAGQGGAKRDPLAGLQEPQSLNRPETAVRTCLRSLDDRVRKFGLDNLSGPGKVEKLPQSEPPTRRGAWCAGVV